MLTLSRAFKKNNFGKKYKDYTSTLKNRKEQNDINEEKSNSAEPVKEKQLEIAQKNDNQEVVLLLEVMYE